MFEKNAKVVVLENIQPADVLVELGVEEIMTQSRRSGRTGMVLTTLRYGADETPVVLVIHERAGMAGAAYYFESELGLACSECGGTGKVRKAIREGQGMDVSCPKCLGSRIEPE